MLEIHAIRREDLLTAFSLSAVLRLRRRFYLSAELHALRGRNTSCEAANRRSEKNAFSEAASIFPLRLPLRGLKGASSPFLVDPARRNRWWFSGSLLTSKENNSLNANALCSAHRRESQLKEKTCPTPQAHPRGAQAFIVSPLPSAPDSRAEYAAAPYLPP